MNNLGIYLKLSNRIINETLLNDTGYRHNEKIYRS